MAQIEHHVHVERKYQMLIERILNRENLLNALKRVERNGGSHGIDNMSTKDLRSYIAVHWDESRKSLENGTYKPQPVRRVEIPKPNRGTRLLLLSVKEKAVKNCQVSVMEMNEQVNHLRKCRKRRDSIKTRG